VPARRTSAAWISTPVTAVTAEPASVWEKAAAPAVMMTDAAVVTSAAGPDSVTPVPARGMAPPALTGWVTVRLSRLGWGDAGGECGCQTQGFSREWLVLPSQPRRKPCVQALIL